MNRLSQETSPYLLQHAHNPVDWYPWGEEALGKARAEDKPVLVSIGYAACHWCHVMERESFEDGDTAHFMNEHFVNIKIDREERPDLDHIYMEAVQAITGSGGWPLNVFLTPEGKPFYGGTYYPPRPVQNRPSWRDVLKGVSDAFREKREQVEEQAAHLTGHVARTGLFGAGGPVEGIGSSIFNREMLDKIFEGLMGVADRKEGGFGRAPKFPQTFSIQYLLHYYYYTKEAAALEQACLSLDKMIRGGIYDQLGGGFARYSTDNEWLAPHFEKMLYDNALLVTVLAEAYQLTGKEHYADTIRETMAFVRRELWDAEGGFYSALDADSEGEEGKFYTWDKQEIDAVLGADSGAFCAYYGVKEQGNWEGVNILVRAGGWKAEDPRVEEAKASMLAHRAKRVRPALDDKILLSWNALMNIACCKAYGALGDEEYREWAVRNMSFLLDRLAGEGLHYFFHSYKAGQAKFPAFLDDYAGLIAALLQLQEVTGEASYLEKAKEILLFTEAHFSEEETGLFYFTHQDQADVIVRKKELYDGATPSGNAVMAFNLAYMGIIFNNKEWRDRAARMAESVARPVSQYPGSFGIWATLYQALTYIIPEIVLTGRQPEEARRAILRQLIPYRVFQSASAANERFPLLSGRSVMDHPQIYLCKDYTCQLPVNEVTAFIRLLENVQKFDP